MKTLLEKCKDFITTACENNINLADYDLLEEVENKIIETQLKTALKSWFSRQTKKPNANFYLYFRPATKNYTGKLFITDGRALYNLVMAESIDKTATIEQNFNKIRLQGVLAQLPILSI